MLNLSPDTIRCIEMTIEIWQPPRLDDAELERPDKLDHYRNLPGQHAPSLLRWYIDRIRSLDLIPTNTDPPTGWFGDINFKDLVSDTLVMNGPFVILTISVASNDEVYYGREVWLARQFSTRAVAGKYGR
jgi:hypothetical protein